MTRVAGMPVRALLGRALAIGLTIAAATAIVALLSGSFDETDARIIGTSLGFSIFSAIAAAGAAARDEGRGGQRAIGSVAVALSLAAFALLLYALWVQIDDDGPWQLWGVVSVAALVATHAGLVLRARRRTDGGLVRAMVATSITAALVDGTTAILAIAGVDDIGDAGARIAAVAGVLLLLTSALPPIMRRIAVGPAQPAGGDLAAHVIAATDRILALNPEPEVRRECERLRDAARVR